MTGTVRVCLYANNSSITNVKNERVFTYPQLGPNPLPSDLQYIDMVHEDNNRQLTFPADGLQAIAGLLAVMNRSFHGGSICGLPQMFFDDALL